MAVMDRFADNSSIIVTNESYVKKIEENGFGFIAEHASVKSYAELAAFNQMFGNGHSYIREDDEELDYI